jgi:hypothetical protein
VEIAGFSNDIFWAKQNKRIKEGTARVVKAAVRAVLLS